jgi:hypothetical protein
MTIDERRCYNRLYMRQWRRENPLRMHELQNRADQERHRRLNLHRCFGCGRFMARHNLRIIERMAVTLRGFIPARKFWCGEC